MPLPSIYQTIPRIIAHRGASARAPENTMVAFRLAAELGAIWFELDVTISADGVAVIHHDAELERCSNGTGLVIQKTLAELKKLDCGSWFNEQYKGESLATLTELLAFANKQNIGLNIEIKPTMGKEAETVAAIAKALEQNPPQFPILFSSFNPYALKEAQRQLATVPRALCTEAIPHDFAARLAELDCVGLHFQAELFDAQQVQAVRTAGFGCAAFTVNDDALAQKLFAAGVNAVFSDLV